MLNSCWFHWYLSCHNALCNTLPHNRVEFMLSSCWVQASPWKISDSFTILTVALEKSQIIFSIVYNTNNGVKCLKCHFIGKFRYFARFCLNSEWIQHAFNNIVMQSVAQSIVKFKVKMKSAWIRHEFNTSLSLSGAMAPTKFEPKSWKNLRYRIIDFAWIQHASDMDLTLMKI